MFKRGRRGTYIVNPQAQWRAVVPGIIYIMLAIMCTSIPMFYMMRSTRSLLGGYPPEQLRLYQIQETMTIVTLGVFFAGILTAWIVFTLWRTHKIYGPVVKLTRHLTDLGAGNLRARVNLRANDELQDLAQAVNSMAGNLNEREIKMREELLDRIDIAKQRIFVSSTPDGACEILGELADIVAPDKRAPEKTPQAAADKGSASA